LAAIAERRDLNSIPSLLWRSRNSFASREIGQTATSDSPAERSACDDRLLAAV
jgi:hypothetical protein